MSHVEIYTRRWCFYCGRAKALLERKGVRYHEIDLGSEPNRAGEMIGRAGGRTTVPQIFIDGTHVGGSDDLHDLDRQGRLDEMLAAADDRRPPGRAGQSTRGAYDVGTHQVLILGSGPAGLTAAIYSGRANLGPVVVEGISAGGQLMNTTDVENYPGFPEGVQGPEMMDLFRKQAARFGATFVVGDVTRVDFSSRPFGVWTDETELRAQAVIIATGASPRTLGVKGEQEYAGRGVSYCATCDGFFFRDQQIVVIGGGDTAIEEALFLTRFGSRVTVIHRRDELRASKIMGDRAKKNEKIEFLWNSVLEEVVGEDNKVSHLRVRNVKTDEVTDVPCGGLFIAIGHEPNTALFKDILAMDPQGYLEVRGGSATDIPGVFVAGDVHDHTYRQAVTAAGAGCKAAIECERWLEAQDAAG